MKRLPEGYRIESYCYDMGTGWGDDRYDWGLWVYEVREVVVGRRWFKKVYGKVRAWYFVEHNRNQDHLVQTALLRAKKEA